MKKWIFWMVLWFCLGWTCNAHALDFTASYDNYTTPNPQCNNYDDGKGVSLGLKETIWKDLKGRWDFSHISDVDFPTPVDVKGSYGELRGYGTILNLIYSMKYDKNLTFEPYAGIGAFWWQFRGNPYLQDSNNTVKTDPSLVMKVGAGIDYKLNKQWNFTLNAGWFDTQIHKVAKDSSGQELNDLLDADNQIGLQYFTWTVGVRKRF